MQMPGLQSPGLKSQSADFDGFAGASTDAGGVWHTLAVGAARQEHAGDHVAGRGDERGAARGRGDTAAGVA